MKPLAGKIAVVAGATRGAYLRGYVYDFITTVAAPLTRAVVERALATEPGHAFEI